MEDHLTPPTAALENLSTADSPGLATTNTEKKKPRKLVLHIKPCLKQRKESFIHAHLIALTRQWYGPPKASPSPSDFVSEEEERMNRLNRECFNTVRLSYIRRRIFGELSNMAENKPEHRDKLELAKTYIQQRENRDEVLSIINSVYASY